jgi:hypothetical protein
MLRKPERINSLSRAVKSLRPAQPCTPCNDVVHELWPNSLPSSTDDLVDALRAFVHANSRHNETSAYYTANATQLDRRFTVIADLLAHHRGEGPPPDLACTARSWALFELCRHLGLDVRMIDLFFTEKAGTASLSSHTFIEVRSLSTQQWEVHDPDGNLVYLDTLTHKRLSALDIMAHTDRGRVVGCHSSGKCPDSLRYWLGFAQSFKAVRIGYLGQDRMRDIVIIDDDFFDPYTPLNQPSGKSLIEAIAHRAHLLIY